MQTGLFNRQIFDTRVSFCNSMGMTYWAGREPRGIEKNEQMLMTL